VYLSRLLQLGYFRFSYIRQANTAVNQFVRSDTVNLGETMQLIIGRQTDAVFHLRQQEFVESDVIDFVADFSLCQSASLSDNSQIVRETVLHTIRIEDTIDFLDWGEYASPLCKTLSLVCFHLFFVICAIEAFALR
jgi:hypothetical protein